jgi:hypothetical protein
MAARRSSGTTTKRSPIVVGKRFDQGPREEDIFKSNLAFSAGTKDVHRTLVALQLVAEGAEVTKAPISTRSASAAARSAGTPFVVQDKTVAALQTEELYSAGEFSTALSGVTAAPRARGVSAQSGSSTGSPLPLVASAGIRGLAS